MKELKSKLIIFMIIVPILLIFTTSSVVNITPILVDIPVMNVEILNEDAVSVDIASDNNKIKLETKIIPDSAKTKNITYSTGEVGGTQKAEVLISSDGIITPLSIGTVKIIASAGSCSSAIQLEVYSSKVISVTQTSRRFNLKEGEIYSLKEGNDYEVSPKGLDYAVTWTSSNPSVVSVNKRTGNIKALLSGSAVITAEISGVEINKKTGEKKDKNYTLSYKFSVGATPTETGISFSGEAEATKPTLSFASFDFSYNESKIAMYGEIKLDYDKNVFSSATIEFNENGRGKIEAKLLSTAKEKGIYSIRILQEDSSLITTVYVVKSIMTYANIIVDKDTYKMRKNAQEFVFGIETDCSAETNYSVIYSSSDSSVISVISINNECYATAHKEGSAIISATLLGKNEKEINLTVTPITLNIVNPYSFLSLSENSENFGLENEFVFGKYKIANGSKSESKYGFHLKGRLSSEINTNEIENIENDKLIWSSSDEAVATVNNGILTVGDKMGTTTITVSSSYNTELDENITTSFEINCQPNGVNVQNYDELMYCSQNAEITVLQKDIMLAPVLEKKDFSDYKNYLDNICTTRMATTADNSYYENFGKEKDSTIRYCLEFTADLYGNGHYVNGEYITMSERLFGYTVFRGPLDIVRLNYDNSSSQNVAVKSQDNIVFLIKKNGIKLTNVELKGCSDSSVDGNLSNLNNCGTVLEIIGNDCSISYSKINNGRTVMRVFGAPNTTEEMVKKSPEKYRIVGTVNNCIISYGREFLLKIGSNQVKKNPSKSGMVSTAPSEAYDDASPFLTDQSGKNYGIIDKKDEAFYSQYVMTDITVKDSVFCNAGLFCVGLESTFGGLCLHGYDYSETFNFGSGRGWGNIAGTSYPAVLRLAGDVRFYDWKKVSDVNSDTLIEGDPQILDLVGLNLNVSNLIDSYTGENADKLTATLEGSKYVNGAIAFYGGGKNYSYVDTTGTSSEFNNLTEFSIPLSYLGNRVDLIYYSAGKEDFRFLLYDSTGALNIQKQRADMNDGSAYSWLYKKKQV